MTNRREPLIPESLRHGPAAFGVCALFSVMAVNRFAPEGLNADTMIQSLMSLQHTTLFFWGQNRLANLVPFLLSWITSPLLNMWAHLWVFAISFFGFLAVLAFAGSKRLFPDIAWADRWLAFLVVTAVSLIVLAPHAAAVLLVEGHPYASSLLLLSIAVLILTWAPGTWLTAMALICLFAAIGLNPTIVILAVSLGVLWLFGLGAQKVAFIVLAAVGFFGTWMVLSMLAPAPPFSYFKVDLRALDGDLAASADGMLDAMRPVGLLVVACALAVGGFAGLGYPRGLAVRRACLFLGMLATGWWITFSVNEWVKVANQSHFRFFSVTILAIVVAAALLLFSYTRYESRLTKTIYGAICLAAIIGTLWRPPVRWAQYEIVEAVADYVVVAERSGARFVVGEYWRAWPTVFGLMARGRPAFGLAWRGEGNREAVVAAIRDELGQGRMPLALCIAEPLDACIENAVRVSGFKWVAASEPCWAEACLMIRVAAD